jgi:polyisoprenyl-teichoic acid--peptidoglycan teichoic acid transferase
MTRTSGPQQNYSQWDAPTLPPRLPMDAAPPPLLPEVTGPLPSDPVTPQRRRAPLTRRFSSPEGGKWRKILLALLVVAILTSVLLAHRVWDFGSAISTQGPLTTQTRFMGDGSRVNLLIMGYGGGNHPGANLTDSMTVISFNTKDGATTLISVPRDIWVQVPPGSGNYSKLNTAYQDGISNGYHGVAASPAAGGAEAARKVSDVLGMPVNYWLTINFSGFRSLVDALGGVDVNVPVGWSAQYPRSDDQQHPPGYETITFKTGMQHMSGERAIEYARARYITSPASEGSDFARSARQQLLIHAIVDRMRSITGAPGLLAAMNALQQTIYSNLSLADLAALTRKADVDHAARIGLTDQNVLVDAMSDDGQDILEPANGDWSVIQQYVAARLKP